MGFKFDILISLLDFAEALPRHRRYSFELKPQPLSPKARYPKRITVQADGGLVVRRDNCRRTSTARRLP